MIKGPVGHTTWFKFFGQRYLMGGSLRGETLPDERAVWLDFLCLANEGNGRFNSANRDALATQLLISRELLDRATKKFIEAKRLSVRYDKAEQKEIFIITKWAFYQAPLRRHRKTETAASESPPQTPLKIKKKDIKKEKKKERGSFSEAGYLQRGSKSAAFLSPSLSPNEIKNEMTKEFSEFWEAYPEGDRGDQDQAFDAYMKLREKESVETVERALEGYLSELKNKRIHENFDQAIMYASRFLRGGWKRFMGSKYHLPL